MCGIYGMVSLDGRPLRHPGRLERMGAALHHRGPDGHGVMMAPEAAFGVERLRIVDPHPRADQPFSTPREDVWLACNGQIYNAPAVRNRFPRYRLQSHSDVEVIIPLYLAQGAAGLAELDGMFAVACWDTRRQALVLARDRAGEKPLFYLQDRNEVWFASEVGALLQHPSVPKDLDTSAARSFLLNGYVTEPHTMFTRIRRIESGTVTEFHRGERRVIRYFDPAAFGDGVPIDPADAGCQLRVRLEDAVARQTQADVPIGVFMSGGLDSSLLAAMCARILGPDRTHTFTVRIGEPTYDEGAHARRLAARLGTRHVETRVAERDMLSTLCALTRATAEPMGDPAVVPTHLLAQMARRHVRVVLGGEGADELFGGYPTYLGHRVADAFSRLPAPVRRMAEAGVDTLPVTSRKMPVEFLLRRFVAAAHQPWADRHRDWFGSGLPPSVLGPRLGPVASEPGDDPPDPARAAMLLDFRSYLRDNLLVKVDRATMKASLEARSPYLDRRVVEFGLRLATSLKIRGATTKWVLREAATGWLPAATIRRRKRGLSVPIARWMNHGMRPDVDRLLAFDRLRRQGLLDPAMVRGFLNDHRSGRANHARALWTIFTLQLWLEHWVPEVGA